MKTAPCIPVPGTAQELRPSNPPGRRQEDLGEHDGHRHAAWFGGAPAEAKVRLDPTVVTAALSYRF